MDTRTYRLLLGLAAATLLWPRLGQAQEEASSCVGCHAALSDDLLSAPVSELERDVHSDFGCVGCHGGDAQEFSMLAMDPARGYVGIPEPREVESLCGRCHSDAEFMKRFDPAFRVDQVTEYRTSVHGSRLASVNDQRVATCVGCHPAHSIKPPSDPSSSVHPLNVAETCGQCHADPDYMSPYAIPTDQHDRYMESIHWHMLSEEGDLSAPTCNDCHGNHGAAPPGVSWVGNVCGQCHMVMGELFAESFHSEIFTMLGRPGCATCHDNHRTVAAGDELLGLGEGAACAMCHTESSAGGAVASSMRSLIDSLTARYEAADSILAEAENVGLEVSEAQFGLGDARTALVSARTAVHSFSLEAVKEEVDAGLEVTAVAYASGEGALGEFLIRRLGLAISVALILALIAGLVLKIRKIEQA
ncbi:MAG: hypothetical protein JSW46_12240 [Gemmatimonadota bacterium]|nr:MAG: hypothetical protein JSW46_12240 [Gemmatimonadota bacterium]